MVGQSVSQSLRSEFIFAFTPIDLYLALITLILILFFTFHVLCVLCS